MMSFRPQHALFLAAALALPAVAFFGPGIRHKTPTASSATAFRPASVYGSAAASAPLQPPPPPRLEFVFDCQPFAPATTKACAALPKAEQALLDLVNAYRMPPPMAWSHALAERVEPAFDAAAQWDTRKLAPLERAALQNGVLELLAKSFFLHEKDERFPKIASKGRALLKKLALSRSELGALPASTAVVSEWLGNSADWLQGSDKSSMHTASDGYARAHRQLQNGATLADVVRLVLVDEKGAPYVSDIVQRLVIRRGDTDAVHVCIAELDPLSASCGPPGSLRAIDAVRGAGLIKPALGAPCAVCHTNNHPNATPYGPTTGFSMSDTSESRIKLSVQRALLP